MTSRFVSLGTFSIFQNRIFAHALISVESAEKTALKTDYSDASPKSSVKQSVDSTPEQKQQQIIKSIYKMLIKKPENVCNFVEAGDILGDKNLKIIFRHYATLYIVFCVDASESELGILDLIQVFVETLDKSFKNVCELDLVFHMDKVHYILNEIVTGGLVAETAIPNVLKAFEEQKKLEKNEIPVFFHESH